MQGELVDVDCHSNTLQHDTLRYQFRFVEAALLGPDHHLYLPVVAQAILLASDLFLPETRRTSLDSVNISVREPRFAETRDSRQLRMHCSQLIDGFAVGGWTAMIGRLV